MKTPPSQSKRTGVHWERHWGFCLPAVLLIQVYLFSSTLALQTDVVFKCDFVLNLQHSNTWHRPSSHSNLVSFFIPKLSQPIFFSEHVLCGFSNCNDYKSIFFFTSKNLLFWCTFHSQLHNFFFSCTFLVITLTNFTFFVTFMFFFAGVFITKWLIRRCTYRRSCKYQIVFSADFFF